MKEILQCVYRARMTQAPDDSTDSLEGLETLANIVLAQGRLGEAEQSFRRIVALGGRGGSARRGLAAALRIAYLDLRYRHAPATAVATMNSALARFPLAKMDESERPYDEIARLYADAGQPARARELLTQAGRTRIGRQRGADASRRWTAGAIAMAEGRAWEGEIEIHGAAEALPCPICALPDLARAYEVAGKPDSAIAMYERYVNAPWQRRYETDGIELHLQPVVSLPQRRVIQYNAIPYLRDAVGAVDSRGECRVRHAVEKTDSPQPFADDLLMHGRQRGKATRQRRAFIGGQPVPRGRRHARVREHLQHAGVGLADARLERRRGIDGWRRRRRAASPLGVSEGG